MATAVATKNKKVNGVHRKVQGRTVNTPKPKNQFPEFKHQVVFAFRCGDVDYFQFSDFNNMPPLRSLKTLVFYEEMRMKCTVEYLQLHVQAVDEILMKEKIDIFKIKELNDQLKQRLFIALDVELMYKIASIVYFDNKEDIRDYDFDYNAKKVEHWKKHKGTDFFLLQPVQELLPILKDVSENLEMFSYITQQVNAKHLANLLSHLPENVKEKLKNSSYFSAVVMPAGLEK